MSNNDRAGVLERVSDVWNRYITIQRQLISTAERCSLRGWPDRASDIRAAFRLQSLFCDLALLRFAHRITLWGHLPDETCLSLTRVALIDRSIQQDWDDAMEAALRQTNPNYNALVQEIEGCEASINPEALTNPFQDAQRDPEYLEARREAQAALAECDRELARP